MSEGMILVTDLGIRVDKAPQEAWLSLDLLQSSQHRGVRVYGDEIVFGSVGSSATYRVSGWDAERGALKLQRVNA